MAVSVALGTQLGNYRIEATLGGSGSSVVYRARHVRLDTRAAVKVFSRELGSDEAFTARFRHEVNLVARLDHPHVIPIYDAGIDDGHPYVAMRYVSGGGLKRMLERRGRLSPDRVSPLLAPVADAVDAAHAEGLVHGGVRPGNILLRWSEDGTLSNVFISDFGVLGQPSTADGLTRGARLTERLEYMAPEQVQGSGLTSRADVYSLGCVLYQVVTGRVPFGRAADREHVLPPSEVRDDVPHAVDAPVLRALAADPSERFETCTALMEAYEAATELEMVHDGDVPAWRPAVPDTPAELADITEAPRVEAAPDLPARRGLPFSRRTALVVACTLISVVLGYVAQRQTRGSANGAKRLSPAATRALAAKDPLRGIAAKGVPEFRCAFTRAAPGGAVRENARCAPREPGASPIERLTLALFSTRRALDRRYERARVRAPDAAVRRGSDCRPEGPWGGHGSWFGGKMFCSVAGAGRPAERPSIVWTVNDSLVLGEASARRSSDLGAWWLGRRHLRNPLHG